MTSSASSTRIPEIADTATKPAATRAVSHPGGSSSVVGRISIWSRPPSSAVSTTVERTVPNGASVAARAPDSLPTGTSGTFRFNTVAFGASTSQLSALTATVAAVIDKLEAKGLVERYRSSTDRRVVHTRLTGAGLESLAEAPALFSTDFERSFQALPQQDQAALAEALATMAGLMAHKAPPVGEG